MINEQFIDEYKNQLLAQDNYMFFQKNPIYKNG